MESGDSSHHLDEVGGLASSATAGVRLRSQALQRLSGVLTLVRTQQRLLTIISGATMTAVGILLITGLGLTSRDPHGWALQYTTPI